MVFRCNPLKGCISRNRILTHSLTPFVPLSSFQGFKDGRIERIRDKWLRIRGGLGIRDQRLGIRDYGLQITDYRLLITDYGLRIKN